MNCGEDMVVALNVDYQNIAHWTEGVENAELTTEDPDAPIVNLDANFVIPEEYRHVDKAFPRLAQMRAIATAAIDRQRTLISATDIPREKFDERPFRRPDFAEEWRLLRKAWSLHRRGQDQLAAKKIAAASDLFYKSDPLLSILDWLWRFVMFMSQPHYEVPFQNAIEVIRHLLQMPKFREFAIFYESIAEERGERYFDLIQAYFEGYDDFGQVYLHVASGVALPAGNLFSSIDFGSTRMFYGNAFEAFASNVDVLAYLNNLKSGRSFGAFERLTQKEYLKLDKANRFDAFASTPEFFALCEERDNQIRNASHHGSMRIEKRTQTIRYRVGKGGSGLEHRLSYSTYLARSTKLFLQVLTLFRLEIMMCHSFSMRPPI